MAMKEVGDRFESKGYDRIAVLATFQADLRYEILNNNHNYYLLVSRELLRIVDDPEDPDDWWDSEVTLVNSYPYAPHSEGGEATALQAWLAAISTMFIIVKRISEDEGEEE